MRRARRRRRIGGRVSHLVAAFRLASPRNPGRSTRPHHGKHGPGRLTFPNTATLTQESEMKLFRKNVRQETPPSSRPAARPAALEPLEARAMLSAAPGGGPGSSYAARG